MSATSTTGPASDPVAMRTAMADFVVALHQAYLDQARLLPPGERARLPLVRAAGQGSPTLSVLAVGTRHLHVIATSDPLPAPVAPEVVQTHELEGLTWALRFYDPVVLPELGLIDEAGAPRPADVRRVLGIADVAYHVTVAPGGGLSGHHAQHAGTGLANSHAASLRDNESLRDVARGRETLVDEFAVAERLGLVESVRLLAQAIAPTSSEVAVICADPASTPARIRSALLTALAPRRAAQPAEEDA